MPCPKCRGFLQDTRDELYCIQCGLRPVVALPLGVKAIELPVREEMSGRRFLTASEMDAILKDRRIPLRQRMKKAGLCVTCGKKRRVKAQPLKTLCGKHLKIMRDAAERRFQKARRAA